MTIKADIDGMSIQLKHYERTKSLDVEAQLKGLPPNFIHSLDASAMLSTALLAKRCDFKGLTTIHDSYGAHAGRMDELFDLIREAFIQTHEANPLETFRDACVEMSCEEDVPELPKTGSLELGHIRDSQYFFS